MRLPKKIKWIILEKEDYANYMFVTPAWEGFTHINENYGFMNGRWLSAEYSKNGCLLFMEKDSYNEVCNDFLEKIFTKKYLWDRLNKDIIYYSNKTFALGKKARKINAENLSKNEIIKLIKELHYLQLQNHTRRGPMFILEVRENNLSNYLNEYLKERILDLNIKINPSKAFQILTTPTKNSILGREQEEIKEISNIKDEKERNKRIMIHVHKYKWIEYGLMNKVLDQNYFLNEIKKLRKDKSIIIQKKVKNEINKIRKERLKIIKELKISKKHLSIFNIARDSIYTKAYSKDAQIYSYYAFEHIFEEICRRTSLTIDELKFLTFKEYIDILNGKNMKKEAKERMNYSIHFSNNGKTKIISGKKAKEFRKEMIFIEDDVIEKVSEELKGNSAYNGKAKGKVKIINTVQEMIKIHQGDILISHMTNPDILPAMKKASAFVTDMGGITCHAAIVAREMRKPCIVGTKIATKAFKDGDVIEVDADNGIVRKIG